MDGLWGLVCNLLEALLLLGAAYYLLYGILIVGLITITKVAPLFALLVPALHLQQQGTDAITMILTTLPLVDFTATFFFYFVTGAVSLLYIFLLRGAVNGSPIWFLIVIVLIAALAWAFPLGPGLNAHVAYLKLSSSPNGEVTNQAELLAVLHDSAFRPKDVRTLMAASTVVPAIIGFFALLVAVLRLLGRLPRLFFPILRQGMQIRLPFSGAARSRYQWRRLAPIGAALGKIGLNLAGITALGPLIVIYWLALTGLLNLLPDRFLSDRGMAVNYAMLAAATVVFFLPIWIYVYLYQRRSMSLLRLVVQFVLVSLALIVVMSLLYTNVYGEDLIASVTVTIAIFIGYAARLTFFSSLLAAMDEWRRRSRTSAAQLIQASKAKPILFLRTFDEDDLWVRASNLFDRLVFAHRKKRARIEEIIADEAFPYGPVIALSNPKLGLQPLGAARQNVSDDHWQQYVAENIGASQAVILCLGKTENVRWEIERILALRAVEKLIVVLPTSYPVDRTVTEVSELLAERLGIPDADYEAVSLKRARAIYFDRKRGGHVALLSRQRGERAYATILRSALAGTRRSLALAAMEPDAEA